MGPTPFSVSPFMDSSRVREIFLLRLYSLIFFPVRPIQIRRVATQRVISSSAVGTHTSPAITTGQLIDIMSQAFRIASMATPASVASV